MPMDMSHMSIYAYAYYRVGIRCAYYISAWASALLVLDCVGYARRLEEWDE